MFVWNFQTGKVSMIVDFMFSETKNKKPKSIRADYSCRLSQLFDFFVSLEIREAGSLFPCIKEFHGGYTLCVYASYPTTFEPIS